MERTCRKRSLSDHWFSSSPPRLSLSSFLSLCSLVLLREREDALLPVYVGEGPG